jgi:hypothetical protein
MSKESRSSSSFEKRLNPDGSKNTKYVDLLDEDRPISGQKFVCVSFVCPDEILKQKEQFMFSEFLKSWDFSKSMEKYQQFLNFISYKYNMNSEDLTKDFEEFVTEEKEKLMSVSVEDEFKNFMDKHSERLENDFNTANDFQTSTRGLKIRGSYPTQEEAELRCRMLREVDPHHNIFVGPVGQWMPWNPDAYKTGKVEYLEEELNKLMSEKQSNEEQAKQEFDKRVRESKQQAIAENVKLAKESGNKLTQGITEDGELIGVNEMNTQERVFNNRDEVSSGDIRKELFEGDNVRMEKTGQNSVPVQENITVEQATEQATEQSTEEAKHENVQVEVSETDSTPKEV